MCSSPSHNPRSRVTSALISIPGMSWSPAGNSAAASSRYPANVSWSVSENVRTPAAATASTSAAGASTPSDRVECACRSTVEGPGGTRAPSIGRGSCRRRGRVAGRSVIATEPTNPVAAVVGPWQVVTRQHAHATPAPSSRRARLSAIDRQCRPLHQRTSPGSQAPRADDHRSRTAAMVALLRGARDRSCDIGPSTGVDTCTGRSDGQRDVSCRAGAEGALSWYAGPGWTAMTTTVGLYAEVRSRTIVIAIDVPSRPAATRWTRFD